MISKAFIDKSTPTFITNDCPPRMGHDIFELAIDKDEASIREFNWYSLFEILRYRYNISSSTNLVGISQFPMYNEEEKKHLIDCATKQQPSITTQEAMKYIDNRIEKIFKSIPLDARIAVGLSGGIDSTYLLWKLVKLGYNPVAIHVRFGNYDEVDEVLETCHYLDCKYEIITVTEKMLEENIHKIIEKFGCSYERGSVLLSYFIFNEKPNYDYYIFGDAADNIFAPSMSYTLKFLEKNRDVQEAYDKLSKEEFLALTDDEYGWDTTFLPKYNTRNKLNNIRLQDFFGESPFFHRTRYQQFMHDNHIVVLPFEDFKITAMSLKADSLHSIHDKFALREFCVNNGLPKSMAHRNKKPMKVEPTDYWPVLQKFYSPAFERQLITLDKCKFKREKDKVYVMNNIALMKIWFDVFEEKTGLHYVQMLQN